jgi:two-component system phosphate regulon sensor histidine kinase PhoR
VSHQLKTPLSLLSTAAETVAMDRVRSPEKLAQYFEIIRSEVGRLSALVQRILEFSRMQQRPALEFEEVDLGALVRETVDAFESGLRGRPVAFRVEQDGPAPHLQADPAALEQVLANLLDNAVKYSDAATEVTVRVGWSGSDAVVEVRDRGIGIAPEDRRRIFEKFYRGSGAAHHRRGFGLGLAIVQELVAAHRGRIEVDSVPHEGSTFRIVLPVARPYRRPPGAAVEVTR